MVLALGSQRIGESRKWECCRYKIKVKAWLPYQSRDTGRRTPKDARPKEKVALDGSCGPEPIALYLPNRNLFSAYGQGAPIVAQA